MATEKERKKKASNVVFGSSNYTSPIVAVCWKNGNVTFRATSSLITATRRATTTSFIIGRQRGRGWGKTEQRLKGPIRSQRTKYIFLSLCVCWRHLSEGTWLRGLLLFFLVITRGMYSRPRRRRRCCYKVRSSTHWFNIEFITLGLQTTRSNNNTIRRMDGWVDGRK